MQWTAKRKTEIIDSVKQNIRYNNFIGNGLSPRLAETECFLDTSLYIFLDYVDSIKVNEDIKKFQRSAMSQMHKILIRQEAKMKLLCSINDPEAMFQVIAKVFSGNKPVPSKPSEIVKLGYGIYKENAYLDPDDALRLVQDALKNWGLTKISLNKVLLSLGVLSTDRSRKTTKKLRGKRMLVIPTVKLWYDVPLDGMIPSSHYESFSKIRKLTNSDFSEDELPLTRTSRMPSMSRKSKSSFQHDLDETNRILSNLQSGIFRSQMNS